MFFTSKTIEKLFTVLHAHEITLYFIEDSGGAVFNYNEMGTVNVDLDNINLDNRFDDDDPDTIFLVRLLFWHIKFEKRK